MEVKWTSKALSDLARLYDFLAGINRQAASGVVQSLVAAPEKLIEYPRVGERLEEFNPRDVRRIIVNHYELRYEVQALTLYVLRLWHTKEDR
jgi:plasmid stabilization system protein ParE